MENAIRQAKSGAPSFFAIDSTHKLNLSGIPLTVLGTVTVQQQFRPIAYFLCDHETIENLAFFLRSVRQALSDLFSFEWQPVFAMADNSAAIRGGCYTVFPLIRVLNCWFHVIQRIQKSTSQNKKEFEDDIRKLHWAPSPEEAMTLLSLLRSKWTEKDMKLFSTFRTSYLSEKTQFWFQFCAPTAIPLTNNPLERYHGRFKGLLGETIQKMSVGRMLEKIVAALPVESHDFSRSFPVSPCHEDSQTLDHIKRRIQKRLIAAAEFRRRLATGEVKLYRTGKPDVVAIQVNSGFSFDDWASPFVP